MHRIAYKCNTMRCHCLWLLSFMQFRTEITFHINCFTLWTGIVGMCVFVVFISICHLYKINRNIGRFALTKSPYIVSAAYTSSTTKLYMKCAYHFENKILLIMQLQNNLLILYNISMKLPSETFKNWALTWLTIIMMQS